MPSRGDPPLRGRPGRLLGRRAECAALGGLLGAVRAGESRALVVRGGPGVGKTALLEYLSEQASDCQVATVAGVQSEMEIAFAGVHQLCSPMLARHADLPGPQGKALRTALGVSPGPVPDRFLLGLAVLSLLSEVARAQPLVCLADDVQWLDRASAQVLAFVARRLGTESVGLVFGARVRLDELAGLPELRVGGLADPDARSLLDSALAAPLDERVRQQIIAEAHGNPLALLELPRSLSPADMAGGFGLPSAAAQSGSIEESFQRRFAALPADSRVLVLLAAADPSGDPVLVWRAAGRLGIGAAAARPAAESRLIEFGQRMLFRHPLVRSAAYQAATEPERRTVHAALAQATDPAIDPDRRAWHRAHAAEGPDEDVARELERSAQRAQARGGVSAGAAFLERAAMLTPDPAARIGRTVAAAEAKVQAGSSGAALDLLAMAEAAPLSDLDQARVHLVRAHLAFAANRGSDAPLLLLEAARRLESSDPALSRATYLDALLAAGFAGRLASPGSSIRDIVRAAAAAPPPPGPPRPPDLLLDAMAAFYSQDYALALPVIHRALAAMDSYQPTPPELRWLSHAYGLAHHAWDYERCASVAGRYVRLTRETGALTEVPLALIAGLQMLFFAGDLTAAASLIEEIQTATEATGSNLAPYPALHLAALRGDRAETLALIETTVREASSRGEGFGISAAEWSNALLHNGLGRFREALAAAQRANAHLELGFSHWAVVELVEAAALSGRGDAAAGAYRRLAEVTGASGTDWGLGIQARSRALVSRGDTADRLYRESIARLGRTALRTDLARAHLLYGEWLLRNGRHGEARPQLRTAHSMLETMGMEGFAGRARHGLRATGESVRQRTMAREIELTSQEAQIARLARDGLSNPEIGARLFISARTVQYHLKKVFSKLGISSRGQLYRVLPDGTAGTGPHWLPEPRLLATIPGYTPPTEVPYPHVPR